MYVCKCKTFYGFCIDVNTLKLQEKLCFKTNNGYRITIINLDFKANWRLFSNKTYLSLLYKFRDFGYGIVKVNINT